MLVLYNCIHYMHIKKVYNVGEKKYRGKYVRFMTSRVRHLNFMAAVLDFYDAFINMKFVKNARNVLRSARSTISMEKPY